MRITGTCPHPTKGQEWRGENPGFGAAYSVRSLAMPLTGCVTSGSYLTTLSTEHGVWHRAAPSYSLLAHILLLQRSHHSCQPRDTSHLSFPCISSALFHQHSNVLGAFHVSGTVPRASRVLSCFNPPNDPTGSDHY